MKTRMYNIISNKKLDEIAANVELETVRNFTYSTSITPEQERERYLAIAGCMDKNKGRNLENEIYVQRIINRINGKINSLIEKIPEDKRKDKELWPEDLRREIDEWRYVSNDVLIKCLPSYK